LSPSHWVRGILREKAALRIIKVRMETEYILPVEVEATLHIVQKVLYNLNHGYLE
jgi:hypothetical protein